MPDTRLREASLRTVGAKQTLKALQTGRVMVLFVAHDADDRVTAELTRLAAEAGVDRVLVPSMRELGKACGIDVGAAAAAILKA